MMNTHGRHLNSQSGAAGLYFGPVTAGIIGGFEPESGYGADFRCVAGKDSGLTIIFAMPERIDQPNVLAGISAMPINARFNACDLGNGVGV
jgi:hypothetical protein